MWPCSPTISTRSTSTRPSLNFHCYGLALERLDARVYYDARNEGWKAFSAVSNIHDARPDLQQP